MGTSITIMVRIEIITHCWAGQLRQYATMLRCQLASLANHPPQECEVTISVCFSSTDSFTVDVINDYVNRLRPAALLVPVDLAPEKLFRRAIGRNIVARQCTADVVWFTDCDYMFGEGCLDTLAAQIDTLKPLSYPAVVNIHRDHATGDAYLYEVNVLPRHIRPPIRKTDFKPQRMIRAIGGVMIVTGEVAALGFCDKSRRFMAPIEETEGWQRSRCDRAARIEWGFGTGRRIELPEVYRLRHSKISYEKRETPASHD